MTGHGLNRRAGAILFSWILLAACSTPQNQPDASDGGEDADGDGSHDPAGDPPFEGPGCPGFDSDSDTIPDWQEGDADHDGDALPDFMDEDSDGDTILDRHEAGDFDCNTPPIDSDGDGTPDFLDLDSDNDTLPDQEEAGDDNLQSYPRDTDGWGSPDFRDTDSDNDGLSDAQETGLGTDPYDEDTDGDGFSDIEEIASASGDPLDPEKGIGENEDIFTLWYKGRSAYQVYTAEVHYLKNDVFFIVDDTPSASEATALFRDEIMPRYYPQLNLNLDGVKAGLGVFSGWGMPDGLFPFSCFHPFYGLLTMTGDAAALEEAAAQVPQCPEPLAGSSVIPALFGAAARGNPGHWLPDMRECAGGGTMGGACFRSSARRFIFLLAREDFPPATPEGFADPHDMDEIAALLQEEGIHLVGFVQQDEPYTGPYQKLADLARESGAVDRTLRPLVYLTGSGGSGLSLAMESALSDVKRFLPSDVTIVAVDGSDWPQGIDANGDGEPENYDATSLVSTIYPRGWSPPPGVSPSEAVSHVEDVTYFRTIPDTEVSYRIYFRNYSLEQQSTGYVFEVNLVLENQLGYIFKTWPVKLIVPCQPGDVYED
jgi:hypothetical protein